MKETELYRIEQKMEDSVAIIRERKVTLKYLQYNYGSVSQLTK